jgi:hypothetical protein
MEKPRAFFKGGKATVNLDITLQKRQAGWTKQLSACA